MMFGLFGMKSSQVQRHESLNLLYNEPEQIISGETVSVCLLFRSLYRIVDFRVRKGMFVYKVGGKHHLDPFIWMVAIIIISICCWTIIYFILWSRVFKAKFIYGKIYYLAFWYGEE